MLLLLTQAGDMVPDQIPGEDMVPLVPDTGATLTMSHPGNTDIPVSHLLVPVVPGITLVPG